MTIPRQRGYGPNMRLVTHECGIVMPISRLTALFRQIVLLMTNTRGSITTRLARVVKMAPPSVVRLSILPNRKVTICLRSIIYIQNMKSCVIHGMAARLVSQNGGVVFAIWGQADCDGLDPVYGGAFVVNRQGTLKDFYFKSHRTVSETGIEWGKDGVVLEVRVFALIPERRICILRVPLPPIDGPSDTAPKNIETFYMPDSITFVLDSERALYDVGYDYMDHQLLPD